MRLTIGLDFEGGAWPPLSGTALAGEAIEGPSGLLKRLETGLGLAGPVEPQAERLAALVPAFKTVRGHFSDSAETDPFGTARRLLRERDELMLAGWELQPVTARLGELAALSREMRPGVPDRLRAVLDVLARRGAGFERIALVDEERTWPLLWRRVFAALRARGTRVEHAPPPTADTSGDLRAARDGAFEPQGDGSLVMLRGAGPLDTADELAAYLASIEHGTTVVVTPDAVLDAALARHGLPTTGAAGRALDSAALQVLPLVLELLWDPPAPAAAHELLGLPASPIPQGLAWRLRRALEEWPAVRSDGWNRAFEEWRAQELIDEPDEEKRTRRRARAELLLSPGAARGAREVPVTAVFERIDSLLQWGQGRLADDATGAWLGARAQAQGLRSLLSLGGVASVAPVRLRKLVELASDGIAAPRRHDAQAGIHKVDAPGAIAGPADTIVWWDFDRDHSPPVRGLMLTNAERTALAAAGVELPTAGERAVDVSRGWRRPLVSATRRLVLCCPRRSESGEERAPHALWDEIEAAMPKAQRATHLARVVQRKADVARTPRTLRATPQPRRDWKLALPLVPRAEESASSLEGLVGCSYQWAARYGAKLSEHPTRTLRLDNRELGKLAHHVLEQLLQDLPATPEEARTKAAELFTTDGPRLVAELFQPGADAKREESSRVVAAAAEGITRFIRSTGRSVAGVETRFVQEMNGWKIQGQLDLLLGEPNAIIDFKYSGRTYRRASLENGTSVQLATYAFLVTQGRAPMPPVAYFIVNEQSLHSTEADGLGGGVIPAKGPTPQDTWDAFHAAIEKRWGELRDGALVAPGIPNELGEIVPRKGQLGPDGLVLEPPCRFCQYDTLCGITLGEGT